ncbi:hypothetical protein BDV11DRAFT_166664 [Aspergillus similis]
MCRGQAIEAIGAGCLGPFRVYSSQYEPELIRASEEYCLSCLWPGLTPGLSGANTKSWFPLSLSDRTLYTAFLFGSLSHMRVQALNGWIPRHMFHARRQHMLDSAGMETVKLVSQEINNPSRAFCDAVIWSVICMAHNKAEDDLTEHPPPPFTAPMQRLQWLDGTAAEVDRYHAQLRPLGLPRGLAELICAMNTYTALVDRYLTGRMSLDPCLLADQRNLIQYTLICFPPAAVADKDNNAIQPQHNPQKYIYECFRLASLIYSVGVILPLPAQSTPLVSLAGFLHNVLLPSFSDDTFHHFWNSPHAQVVLLWILTLGGIAATHTPDRAWFVATLSRVAHTCRIVSYNHLRGYLARVAWYPVACDWPGMELWNDVEKFRREAVWGNQVYRRPSG